MRNKTANKAAFFSRSPGASRATALAVMALMAWHVPAAAQIPPHERQILTDLYRSANKTSWNYTGAGARWAYWAEYGVMRPAGTECRWYGIRCANGSVVEISLGSGWVFGRLPDSLSGLKELKSLELDGVKLSDLSNLSRLTGVTSLSISGSDFSGPLPNLSGLKELESLKINETNFSGPLPDLRNFPKLRIFDVSSNKFSGDIANVHIAGHPSLEKVNVAFNRLTGTAPRPAPANLEKGGSDLCPNLLKAHDAPDWRSTNEAWIRATFKNVSEGSLSDYAYDAWAAGEGVPYADGFTPISEFYWESVQNIGCRGALAKPLNHDNLLEVAHHSEYLNEFNQGEDFYHVTLGVGGEGGRYERGFVDVIKVVGLDVETYPGWRMGFGRGPSSLVAYHDHWYLTPTDIFFSSRPHKIGETPMIEYRLCAGRGGKEPCTETARVKLHNRVGRMPQKITKFNIIQSERSVGYYYADAVLDTKKPVHYANFTPDVCTIMSYDERGHDSWAYWNPDYPPYTERYVKALKYGTCNIAAYHPGNSIYDAARPVMRSFVVDPKRDIQTITFPSQNVPAFAVGRTFALQGITGGNSANPVVVSSRTPAVCTVAGRVVTMRNQGTCIIVATQAGNANYAPATMASRSFVFSASKQGVQPGAEQALLPLMESAAAVDVSGASAIPAMAGAAAVQERSR